MQSLLAIHRYYYIALKRPRIELQRDQMEGWCFDNHYQCALHCAFASWFACCNMLLHKHFACVKCIVSSLHNYIVLVTGTTIIKQVIMVRFNVCHRAQGQSLNVHFEPDEWRCTHCDYSYDFWGAVHLNTAHCMAKFCSALKSQELHWIALKLQCLLAVSHGALSCNNISRDATG